MTFQTAIVHEAEVQRQHARLRVPLRIDISNQMFDAFDWSVGGFSLETATTLGLGLQTVDVTLHINFNEFAILQPMRAQMRHETPTTSGQVRTGFEFVDVTRDQTSTLRYVSGAILSGELVHSGDLFAVVNRDNSAKARKKEPPAPTIAERFSIGRMLTFAAAFVFVVGILGLVASIIYERAFLISATVAEVTIPAIDVRAPQDGVLVFTAAGAGGALTNGSPMLGIEQADGAVRYMDSPCDCSVLDTNAEPGMFVRAGEPVMRITNADQRVQVRAFFDPEAVKSLNGTERAELRFLGTTDTVSGSIESVHLDQNSGQVAVIISPATDLPISLVGRAADVFLSRAPVFSSAAAQSVEPE
ncbi:MAG: alginate biosynthesis protein Alg44 [Pseudomonadota bacterium]